MTVFHSKMIETRQLQSVPVAFWTGVLDSQSSENNMFGRGFQVTTIIDIDTVPSETYAHQIAQHEVAATRELERTFSTTKHWRLRLIGGPYRNRTLLLTVKPRGAQTAPEFAGGDEDNIASRHLSEGLLQFLGATDSVLFGCCLSGVEKRQNHDGETKVI